MITLNPIEVITITSKSIDLFERYQQVIRPHLSTLQGEALLLSEYKLPPPIYPQLIPTYITLMEPT